MNNLQMLKKAMLAYVSAVKFVWSEIAYPLSIVGKKFMNLRGYRVYGNSVQDGTPSPETPIEIESVGDLSTKNLLDIDTFNTTAASNFINYNKTTGIITCNYGVYGNGLFFHSNIETLRAGTYTISCEVLYDPVSSPYNSFMYMGVSGYDENGTRKVYSKKISASDATTWTKKTVTINVETDIDMSDASSTIIGIEIQPEGSSQKYTSLNLQIRNVMIAEGDVNDDYEPYHKYKIPVVARGRNLIPMFTFKIFTSNGVTFTNNNDGSITLNGTPTGYAATPVISLPESSLEVLRNNACVLTGFYDYWKNIALTLNAKLNGNSVKTIYMDKYSYGGYVKVDLRDISFDSISFSVKRDANDILIDNVTVKPFLEVGTTMPTSFEPYVAPVTTNIFLDEPLRKVGNYADYVDFEKQKVVRNVNKYNLSEISALGSFNDKTTYWYGYWHIREPYPISINKLKIISDKFKCIYPRNADVEDTYLSNDVPPYDSAMYYSVEKKYCPEVETSAEMLDWLRGTNADLFYVLATPIEETVNLPALPQFKGTTIYEVGTNIKPSGMEAKYI